MSTITIPKTEYKNLKERADAYERMLEAAQTSFSLTPPEKSRKKIITSLKKTGKYNQSFLSAINKGLRRSDYFIA